MSSLIFLDVDGVLNWHENCPIAKCGRIVPHKILQLREVIIDTGAKVVITSAWRYLVHRGEMNLVGLNWLFRSHGMPANCIIGVTREDGMQRDVYDADKPWPITNERGQQIADWRKDNNHEGRYVVVDDIDLGITEAGHPFVQTVSSIGLTTRHTAMIARILGVKDHSPKCQV